MIIKHCDYNTTQALHTLFIAVVVQTTKKKCIRLKKTLEYSHLSKILLLQVPHTELYQQEIQACISRHKNVVLLYEATWVQFCSDKNHFFRDTQKILHRWRLCYIFKRLPFFLLWLWTSPGTTCSNLKKVVTCQVLRTNTYVYFSSILLDFWATIFLPICFHACDFKDR